MKIEVYSPTIRRKEMDAVLTALVEDKIGPGEQARVLVQIAREKLKFDYCISLRSPAIALYEALKTLKIENGGGVVISALSPPYYKKVLDELRLVPLYADVLQGAAFMGRESIEKALAEKPESMEARAIVLHHTLGFVPDAASIAEFGLPLIEDCSESFGTITGVAGGEEESVSGIAGGVPAGSAGFLTILGLEEQDMLTAGSGALLYAAHRRDASVLRNLGELPPEYGLPDMNAAMGVVQFREASKNLEKRREIAQVYIQSASRTRHKRFAQGSGNPGGFAPEYNNYAFPLILETGMKDVKSYARRKDIAVESAFEKTLMGVGIVPPEQCPEAYSLSLRTVLFPLYPRLTASEAEKVAKLITSLP